MSSPDAHKYHCEFCQYDMTGVVSGICPECGKPVLRYTDRLRAVVVEANAHAIAIVRGESVFQPRAAWWRPRSGARFCILPYHMLMGICTGPEGVGRHVIECLGVDPKWLCYLLGKRAPVPWCRHDLDPTVKLPLDLSTLRLVHAAISEAAALGQDWVGTEHMLLALFARGDGVTHSSFHACRLTPERAREVVVRNAQRLTDDERSGSGRS